MRFSLPLAALVVAGTMLTAGTASARRCNRPVVFDARSGVSIGLSTRDGSLLLNLGGRGRDSRCEPRRDDRYYRSDRCDRDDRYYRSDRCERDDRYYRSDRCDRDDRYSRDDPSRN